MSFIVADLAAALGLKVDESAWKRGDALISGARKAVEAFVGYEAVKHIGEAINSTIEYGSKLNDLAQSTSISTDALQFYGYVAKQNSSNLDELASASNKLSKGLGEVAKTGSGPAADSLKALGLNFADIEKLAPEDRIEKIANAFVKLGPAANKQAIAMGLFGKTGAALIPTLNDLGNNYDKLNQEFDESGAKIGNDQIKELDDLGDNLDKVKNTLGGVKTQIVLALLPAVKNFVEGLQAWIKENRELIRSGIESAVTALSTAFSVLGTVIGVVVDVIKFFQEHETLAGAAIVALGAIIASFAIAAAADWLIAFAPFVAIFAAVTGVILIINELFKAVLDGEGIFIDFGRGILDAFKAIGKAIWGVFTTIGNFFTGVAESVQAAFTSVIDWISDKIDWIWGKVKGAAEYVTHPWEIVTDAVGYFTGDDEDPSSNRPAATRDFAPDRGNTTTVSYGDTHVKVDAKNADAEQVADIVDKKIKENHDRVWRDAHASTNPDDPEDQ